MASEPPLPHRASRASLVIPPLVAAGLAVVARLQPLRGADVLWQIRSGEEILRTHARVPVDLYSFAFRGRPIFDHEAGFELVVALIHRALGMRGLWWTTMLLAVAVVSLATHAARKLVPSAAARVIGAAVVVTFIASRSELRAELATFAAIGVAHALRRAAADDDTSRRAMLLRMSPIAATAVAAQFHGLAWWTAVVPVAHALAGAVAPRKTFRRVRFDLAVAALCLGVVALGSFGVVALNAQSVAGSAIIEHINELRTPWSLLVTMSNVTPALAFLVGVIALIGLARLRVAGAAQTSDWVLFAMLLVPGVRYARFAPMPLIAAMPWAIAGVGAVVAIPRARRFRTVYIGVPAIVAALSVVVMTAEYGADQHTVGLDESAQPVEAVRYLREHHPNAALFHPYNFGPYLIFVGYPPRGVVIDPRAQMVYPNDYVRRYYQATTDPLVFEQWATEAPFDTVLLSRRHKGTKQLRDYLYRSPNWRAEHEDLVAVIFVRR